MSVLYISIFMDSHFYVFAADIDECAFNRDGCSNDCNNTVGSYTCLCPLGYELDSDQRKCLSRFFVHNKSV